MSDPPLSIVIASVNGRPYIGRCLDSLETHCPEAEVIVADCTDEETRRQVRERWPSVQLISFGSPMAVPELRAAGIAVARAPYVAVIEDHCVVRNGWARRIVELHEGDRPVVGGPVRNGVTDRLRDWAGFLCEYSLYIDPNRFGPGVPLTGMNVSYRRDAIEAMDELLREGRWESWLHPHLERCGFELYSDPGVVLDHVKDFGFREFTSQRYHYARSYAGMRNAELGLKRAVYLLGAPALVPLVYARIAGNVFRARRHRREFLLSTPLILFYLGTWAAGEAVGYAFGGGRSILKVR